MLQYLAKIPCLHSHRLDSRHRMLPIPQTFAHAVCFAVHTVPAAGRVSSNQPLISDCSVVVLEIAAGGGRWAAGGAEAAPAGVHASVTQLTDVKEPGDLLVCMCRQLEVVPLQGQVG